jgi:hypothetical protein
MPTVMAKFDTSPVQPILDRLNRDADMSGICMQPMPLSDFIRCLGSA